MIDANPRQNINRHREQSAAIQKGRPSEVASFLDCRVANAPRSDGCSHNPPRHLERSREILISPKKDFSIPLRSSRNDGVGFTLIELSIVLVIIGLIAGGVLVGQDLIRGAQLRSVTTEFQKYQAANMAFRNKYSALPGDMPNATTFWPTGTANGNGDGIIGTPYRETYRAWQHLALSGMISGTYTGATGPGHSIGDAITNVNVPQSKLDKNAGWCFGRSGYGDPAWRFPVSSKRLLYFGQTKAAAGDCSAIGILTPLEALDIDTKMDDGMPATGSITGDPTYRCTNAWTDTTKLDAIYSYGNSYADTKYCNLIFQKAY